MKSKKELQTSLRIIKCSLCGRYVLFNEMFNHMKSNCTDYYIGKKSVKEKEGSLSEIKSIKSFLAQESTTLNYVNNPCLDIQNPSRGVASWQN